MTAPTLAPPSPLPPLPPPRSAPSAHGGTDAAVPDDCLSGPGAPGGASGAAVSSSELEGAPLEELERDVVACASNLFALEARFLRLLAVFDRREGWAGAGIRSCAHWLSWRCGISLHSARERVRVARALEALPRVAESFQQGRISYSKVRAVSRVATPADEHLWLDLAESGTATHVERVVAGVRSAARAVADDGDGHDGGDGPDDGGGLDNGDDTPAEPVRGEVHRRFLPNGLVEITLVLDPEDAELVMRALDRAGRPEPTPPEAPPATDSGVPRGARRSSCDAGCDSLVPHQFRSGHHLPGSLPGRLADGLRVLAESFLAHGPSALSGDDRYLLLVHVDADVLAEGREAGPFERADLQPDGARLSAAVLRRIGCDASLQGVVLGADGAPLAIGNARRVVGSRTRRALVARDGGCVFPGCTERRWVDAHHIVHWADGGPTTLANLALLCRFHHTLVHERGFAIQVHDGHPHVIAPDGARLALAPTLPGSSGDVPPLDGDQHVVDEPSLRWNGEPLDLNWAVGAMCDSIREARQRT